MASRSTSPTGRATGQATELPLASPHALSARRLGNDLLVDWAYVVRAARPDRDLDAVLHSVGFRQHIGANSSDRCAGLPEAVPHEKADRRLAQLVEAARHDPLAARVVLQRLLPGILAIARRRGDQQWTLTLQYYDDLLATAWIVIRCFPVERRPTGLAGNLLRDIEYQTFTRPKRLRRVATCALAATDDADNDDVDYFQVPPSSNAFVELVEVLRCALENGLEEHWIEFAAALASGQTLEETAAARSRTTRAERYRRAQLVSRIRSIVLD